MYITLTKEFVGFVGDKKNAILIYKIFKKEILNRIKYLINQVRWINK